MNRVRRLSLMVAIVTLTAAVPLVVWAEAGRSGRRRGRRAAQAAAATEASNKNRDRRQHAAAVPAAPAGVCIRPVAREAVEQCPQGRRSGKRRQPERAEAPGSHFRETKRRQPTKSEGMTGPGFELDPAARRNQERLQQRAKSLLLREVRVLERLVSRARPGNPRGAQFLLRLAETYFELQRVFSTEAGSLDQPIFEARQARNGNRVRQLLRSQNEAKQKLERYREDAIRTYARLVQNYPNFRDMDRVLFSLAFGLEEMRQFQRARQVYHRLIKNYPQSNYIPHAYLSFAEYYFGEGEDMRAAQQFYDRVTQIPPERNPVYGYALYKQAWAFYNLDDFRGALNQFVRVIEFGTRNRDARDASNLVRQSRRELVLPYSRVGRPNRALDFFRRYAENDAQAREMLEALAELYYDTGQWPETIEVYHRLIASDPQGHRVCYWQSRVANAVVSSRPKADQVTEVRRLVDLYKAYKAAEHPQEAMAECKREAATVLVGLATAWHREAIGSEEQPGTNDRRTMGASAALYRLVLREFPDMEQMRFPDIDRRDWPTEYRVSYFYAELLWRMEDWGQCGPAFDRVVELDPQGEFTSDAAYAAVLCYNNLYQQNYQSREREVRQARESGRRRRAERASGDTTQHVPRELSASEQGMLNAFQRFVCFVADSDELPTVKYRLARIYYESNRFEEASILFKDIAINHSQTELAEFAANLYLDSLNVLGTEWHRSSCIGNIRESLGPFSRIYCSSDSAREEHPDLCGVVSQLECDTLRLQAEAAGEEDRHRDAGSLYTQIARDHPECGRRDEMLYNAAIHFEAARLLGRAIRVRTVLIQNFPRSRLAKRAIYLVGANYHALAIYNKAAEWYERFAREFPGENGSDCTEEERSANTCAVANEALQNAVFFRLGLGQEDEAISDARLFERNYNRRLPRETSQVQFSLGSIYERQRNWEQVFRHYRGWLRRFGRRALPHEIVRANVQMGRSYWEQDNKDGARRYFRAALQAWERGAARRIAGMRGVSDEDRNLYLVRAKDATSEALFYLAEYDYAAFRMIRFPRLRGARNLSRVQRWAQSDFAQWLTQKREALQEAETAFNRIAPLEIPEWQIAAASRVGQMYRSFMDQIRGAPIPEEIENDDELYGIYVDALERAAAPLQAQAMEKFQFCLTLATRVRWFNEFSSQCEQELNRLDAARYPMAAELRGSAAYVERQVARPGAVTLVREEDDGLGAGDNSVPEGGAE